MSESNSVTNEGVSGPNASNDKTATGAIGVEAVTGADASLEQTTPSAATNGSMVAASPGDGDMLRLADLLQGEHDGNLDALLTFSSDGTNTTVHVSAGGDRPTQDQDIVLQGVGDLTAGGARSASVIIADLLMQGTFGTDSI